MACQIRPHMLRRSDSPCDMRLSMLYSLRLVLAGLLTCVKCDNKVGSWEAANAQCMLLVNIELHSCVLSIVNSLERTVATSVHNAYTDITMPY